MHLKNHITAFLVLLAAMSCEAQQTHKTNRMPSDTSASKPGNPVYSRTDTSKVELTDAEWKKILSPELYYIARQKGTERPWTSRFENFKEVGTYYCAACGNPLFKSDTKFESGCGWPSFYQPISKSALIYTPDYSHGMTRTEVQCGRCKAHLGHVFEDGPPPTGLRYCINGVILDFEQAQATEKKYKEGQ
ncbi:MAG: peptide-methionine (R)-S-oxide reductase MsrB [Lacibacter sp.]